MDAVEFFKTMNRLCRTQGCDIEKSIGCTEKGKTCYDCRREYWIAEVTDND